MSAPYYRPGHMRVGSSTLGRDNVFLPMEPFEKHRAQALYNHGGQSLERLAERGGLSWCEAAAILEDRGWHKMDSAEAERVVRSNVRMPQTEPRGQS